MAGNMMQWSHNRYFVDYVFSINPRIEEILAISFDSAHSGLFPSFFLTDSKP
jgi:hypothetical protein